MIRQFIFWILLISGFFLVFDGTLSLWWGNECLNQCANNNIFGNIIRVIRTIIGTGAIVIAFIIKFTWKR